MKETYGTRIIIDSGPMTGHGARRWTKSVFACLDEIQATRSGQCVLAQLHRGKTHVTVTPWFSPDLGGDTAPVDQRASYYPFRPVRDGVGGIYEGLYGTGKGSNAVIRLTPFRLPLFYQASALLHELVHAAEDMVGMLYCNPIGWQFLTVAEFDAIVVQNIFLSERGRAPIQNHESGAFLVGKMVPQVDAYKRLLSSFKARMPAMVEQLSRVKAAFNPYRQGAGGYVALA